MSKSEEKRWVSRRMQKNEKFCQNWYPQHEEYNFHLEKPNMNKILKKKKISGYDQPTNFIKKTITSPVTRITVNFEVAPPLHFQSNFIVTSWNFKKFFLIFWKLSSALSYNKRLYLQTWGDPITPADNTISLFDFTFIIFPDFL